MDSARGPTLAMLKEVDRNARVRMRTLAGASLLGAALLQIVRSATPLFWITTALLLLSSVCAGVIELRTGRDRAATPKQALLCGALFAVATLAATAYLGALSSVSVVLCALVFGWALGGDKLAAWGVYLTSAVGYLVVVGLAVSGALPPVQLALARDSTVVLLGLTVVLELVLAVSFWVGRRTRLALEMAMVGIGQAEHEIHQRDALLDEARADLRDMLDGAKLGPFSGKDVGSFRLHEVIGRGAVGEIYRAVHSDGGAAAIKLLVANAQEDRTSLQRFFREVEVVRALESPHVVKVLESGTTDRGVPYLAMELLEGADLASLLRERKQLSLAEVVDLVTQLAQALDVAERAEIVHRDLKPQNVFRTEREGRVVWKLLDFGVSKLRETDGTLTQGAAVGTPGYMSPEQVRGLPVDHRSDVFSLGAIAYRALTGRPAFTGRDPLAIMYCVHHNQPTRPSALVDIGADMDGVFAVALAKDPERRFGSASELAGAFAAAAEGRLSGSLRSRAHTIVRERPWRRGIGNELTLD